MSNSSEEEEDENDNNQVEGGVNVAVAESSCRADKPFRDEEELQRILDAHHPHRMKLTRNENRQAQAIKNDVEANAELDNLPDFWYAQLAIVCKDDTSDAVERCQALQLFKKEFEILDSYEAGHPHLEFCFDLFPQHYVKFEFSEKTGTYTCIFDAEKFDPARFTAPEMKEEWIRHQYYMSNLMFPDIESCRKGIVAIVECQGIGLRTDVLKCYEDLALSFLATYPINAQTRLYHAGCMVNVSVALIKKLFPNSVRETIQGGYQLDEHLGEMFLTPTMESANRRMMANMEAALTKRYENEVTFSLT